MMIKIPIIQLIMKKQKYSQKYKSEANKIKNFSYGGRLADYAYYDMDMTISADFKKVRPN